MSTFRKHFRVVWNDGQPVDIVTNARDVAEASEHQAEGHGLIPIRLVHCALKRYGVAVPPFEQFVDELDEVNATSPEQDNDRVDPTQPVALTKEPSLSVS